MRIGASSARAQRLRQFLFDFIGGLAFFPGHAGADFLFALQFAFLVAGEAGAGGDEALDRDLRKSDDSSRRSFLGRLQRVGRLPPSAT